MPNANNVTIKVHFDADDTPAINGIATGDKIEDVAKKAESAIRFLSENATSTTQTVASISTTWEGEEAPYTQNIAIAGVKTDSIVEIMLAPTANLEQILAYQNLNIIDGGQTVDQITLKALGTKNVVAIPINVIIRNYGL